MTVFNIRLGWWMGNPRQAKGYLKSGPLNVLGRLVCELFGLTSEEGKFVYLSDGGHFENLGIYELVRRRCRFILACDAEEDHNFAFGGLGNAIEKCRSDFGVDIDIDVEPIRRRSEKGHSQWHCAVGKIFYSRIDHGARDGILIYVKSSLTGDEPTDVLRYAAANPGFPHQSTSDQWFDESQFESYRTLGFHIAENLFDALGSTDGLSKRPKERLFVDLAQAWCPPSAATEDAFTKHTRTIVAIYDELRQNKDLAFLSQHIYPEWPVLFEGVKVPAAESILRFDTTKTLREQLPKTEAELKAGFYICNSVFQLFEDAYVDLKLEDEFDHPDNRGWMNFFKHWSWAPMFRIAWTICASNFGARFQNFCAQHLKLTIGETEPREVNWGTDTEMGGGPFDWEPVITLVARGIAQETWKWVEKLPEGSPVLAKAAMAVDQVAPGTRHNPRITSEQSRLSASQMVREKLAGRSTPLFQESPVGHVDEGRDAVAALLEMERRTDVPNDIKTKWVGKVADSILLQGAMTVADLFKTTAQKISDSIWTWVDDQTLGSDLLTRASVTVTKEAPKSKPDPTATKAAALDAARQLVDGILERSLTQPIGKPAATEKDEEWHAGATLLEMHRRSGVGDDLKLRWAEKIAGMALFYAAVIVARRLSPDFLDEFSTVERELIEFFLVFNPSLATTARVLRLEVDPDPVHALAATPRDRKLHFPFAFALLAKTDFPVTPETKAKLVFLRVQDHVRKMGLARDALEKLMGDQKLEIDLKKMHPKAREVPTQKDRDRFVQLFRSVETAIQQRRDAAAVES